MLCLGFYLEHSCAFHVWFVSSNPHINIITLLTYLGLQSTASQFFISLLVVFLIMSNTYSFFRIIGAFSANFDVATRITGVAIQALKVYTGYVIPPSPMHPWFSWIRWINPIQYGFEAPIANESYNLNIQCVPPALVPFDPSVALQYQA